MRVRLRSDAQVVQGTTFVAEHPAYVPRNQASSWYSYTNYERFHDEVKTGFKRNQARGIFCVNDAEWVKSRFTLMKALPHHLRFFQLQNGVFQPTQGWSVTFSHDVCGRLGIGSPLGEALMTSSDARSGFSYPDVTSVVGSAVTRLYAKAGQSDFLGIVAAVELEQTLELLSDLTRRMHATESFLRGISKPAQSFIKNTLPVYMKSIGAHILGTNKKVPVLPADHVVWRKLPRRCPVTYIAWKVSTPEAFKTNKIVKTCLAAAQTWLTYQYGWMSAYYDTRSFLKASKRRQLRRLSITEVLDPFSHETETTQLMSNFGFTWGEYRTWTQATRSSQLSVGMMVRTRSMGASADALGANRPFSSFYELIPMSFVVDWFCNIGDLFKAADGYISCDILASWYVVRHRVTKTVNGSGALLTPPSGWKVTQQGMGDCLFTEEVDHVIRKGNPAAGFTLKFQPKLSASKIASGVALMAVQARRLSRLLRGL